MGIWRFSSQLQKEIWKQRAGPTGSVASKKSDVSVSQHLYFFGSLLFFSNKITLYPLMFSKKCANISLHNDHDLVASISPPVSHYHKIIRNDSSSKTKSCGAETSYVGLGRWRFQFRNLKSNVFKSEDEVYKRLQIIEVRQVWQNHCSEHKKGRILDKVTPPPTWPNYQQHVDQWDPGCDFFHHFYVTYSTIFWPLGILLLKHHPL